ncbi:hypothetical protein K7432_002765 [Basidiobolus ranarum]|uniref:Restriction endonuclease type IV Mrr domain-containing protein n=1 Tax=Basidiobolus ranarum TaxID=34480 RepID=A0ABR2X116_9FUNG
MVWSKYLTSIPRVTRLVLHHFTWCSQGRNLFFNTRRNLTSLSSLDRTVIHKPNKRSHNDLESFLQCDYDPTSKYFVGTLFEYQINKLLKNFHIETRRCGGSDDKGVDLRGSWTLPGRTLPIVAQCKHEKKKVGPNYVREIQATVERETPGTLGILVSNKGFTKFALAQFSPAKAPIILITVNENLDIVGFHFNLATEKLLPELMITRKFSPTLEGEIVWKFAMLWNGVEYSPHTNSI